jgi:hypothetical protein
MRYTRTPLRIIATLVACFFCAPLLIRAQTASTTPPPAPKTMDVAGNVMAAKRMDHTQPVYPADAREAGTVKLHAVIGKDGTVESLEVISGPPLLLTAARDAARQYRYQPTLLNGEPVAVTTTIDVVVAPPNAASPGAAAPAPGAVAAPAPSAAPVGPGGIPVLGPRVDQDWLAAQEAAASATDPAVAADVRRLLETTGGKGTTEQLVAPILQNVKAQLIAKLPPSDTRDQAVNAFIEKLKLRFNNDDVTQLLIPIFAKHFTREELEAIVAFYESPAGKAYVQKQREMGPDMQTETNEYARKVVMPQIIAAVSDQFPELMKPK